MLAFSRVVGAFALMMAIGYIAMVAFVPAPQVARASNLDDPGQTAAVRLSAEAQALVNPRPVGSLQ